MIFNLFFFILFNPFSAGKIERSHFDMQIIPQTININNLRATNAKSINLHTIRKLIEDSLKNLICKANVYSYRF